MDKQLRLDKKYLAIAELLSEMSYANRCKVGAIIVKENQIISDGYNGMPAGFDNECEDEYGLTNPECLHAESNALMKLAASTHSSKDATLYTTVSPCIECAKLIIQAKIKRVVYLYNYIKVPKPLVNSLDLLRKANVIVEKIDK